MVAALRNTVAGGSALSAKSYVSNGLIALWDGIENAGLGIHDENRQNWLDISGRGLILAPSSGAQFIIGDNYYRTVNNAVCVLANNVDKVLSDATDFTVEMTLDPRLITGFAIIFAIRSSKLSAGIELYRYENNGVPNVYWAVVNNDAVLSINQSIPGNESSLLRNTSVTIDRYGNVRCFVNGQYQAAPASIPPSIVKSITARTVTGCFGEAYNIGRFNGICKANCIRVYNRVITDSEIARNYDIDKARFDLP